MSNIDVETLWELLDGEYKDIRKKFEEFFEDPSFKLNNALELTWKE